MNIAVLFIIFMTSVINLYSQNEFMLIHKSVGKQIDNEEKQKYFLYPTINDSLFISASYIEINDSVFAATYIFIGDSIKKENITIVELQEIRNFITKFDNYYSYQQEKDSLLKNEMDSVFRKGIPNYQSIDNFNKFQSSKQYNKLIKLDQLNNNYKKSLKRTEYINKIGQTEYQEIH